MIGYSHYKFSDLNKDWINSFPRIINSNGCWIPLNKPNNKGYVQVTIERDMYFLHRLAICMYNNLNYKDSSWDSRHSQGCDTRCFNPEHLQSGTATDNNRDIINHGNNFELNKKCCPRCGSGYKIHVNKTGWTKGKTYRFCPICRIMHNKKRSLKWQ